MGASSCTECSEWSEAACPRARAVASFFLKMRVTCSVAACMVFFAKVFCFLGNGRAMDGGKRARCKAKNCDLRLERCFPFFFPFSILELALLPSNGGVAAASAAARALGRAARAAPQLLASPRLPIRQRASAEESLRGSGGKIVVVANDSAEPRPRLPSPSDPLRVAVVGSGPAGCYAASELFKRLGRACEWTSW